MRNLSQIFFATVFACLILQISSEEQPGLRIGISDSAIKAIEEHFLPGLINSLTSQDLPDIVYNTTEPFFGKFLFQLSHIRPDIPLVDYNKLDIQFQDNHIMLNLKVSLINVSFIFNVSTEFYGNSVKGYAALKNVDLVFKQKLLAIPNYASTDSRIIYGPGFAFEEVNINDLQMDLKTLGNSNLELMIGYVVGTVKNSFKTTITALLQKNLDAINQGIDNSLSQLNLSPKIYNDAKVDLSLIGEPQTINNTLELSFNSTFFSNGTQAPQENITLPHVNSSTKQVQLLISVNTLNSLFAAMNQQKFFDFNITYEKATPVLSLNTSTLSLIFPNITEIYGENQPIDISCVSTNSPTSRIKNQKFGIEISLSGRVDVRNATQNPAIQFKTKLNITFNIKIQNATVYVQLKDISITELSSDGTSVLDIDGKKFKSWLNFIFLTGIESINEYIKEGYRISPIQGFTFEEADVQLGEGYFRVEMDPKFVNSTVTFNN